VLTPGRILLCVLVVLAGCSAPPKRDPAAAPQEWTDDTIQPSPAPDYTPSAPVNAAIPDSVRSTTPELSWLSLRRWAAERGLDAPQCVAKLPVATFTLATPKGTMGVQVGSRVASWRGVDLQLGFAPQLINDKVFLHALDLERNLLPLLENFVPTTNSEPAIVVDPGHGGWNTGTRSVLDGRREKGFTLDWALRLAPLLENAGWRVFLTRTNDDDVPLAARVTFADDCHADLFVSLHFNSSGGGTHQAGLETYCLTPTGMPSNLTRGYGDGSDSTFPNNNFDTANIQWAVRIHTALLTVPGLTDRGVRRARFMTVLQGQNRPAVLIEGGFLSNPDEARRIADPSYRQRLAEAVAEALALREGAR